MPRRFGRVTHSPYLAHDLVLVVLPISLLENPTSTLDPFGYQINT
jgi:hypothetical protein